jgi:hypothetical protein
VADEGVIFSAESAKRIGNAVRRIEAIGGGGAGGAGGERQGQHASVTKFFARLTAEDTGSNTGKYKWKAVSRTNSSTWLDYSPSVTSGDEFNARSFNNRKGIKTGASDGMVVELQFVGYDTSSKPLYLFQDSFEMQALRVKCTATGSYSAGVKRLLEGSLTVTGDEFTVAIVHRTDVDDVFWVYPVGNPIDGISWVQFGMPTYKGQFKSLQYLDEMGTPQGADWSYPMGHP